MGSRGFEEIHTPVLVPAGAVESSLDSLKVSWETGEAELHTSPEIAMKVALSERARDLFQICKCFRDDPETGVHWREFTMLEFYQMDVDYRALLELTKALIETVHGQKLSFEQYTFEQIVKKFTDLDLTKHVTCESLSRSGVVEFESNDSWEEMVLKILVEKVEPALDPTVPTVILDYPSNLSALAKTNSQTGLAERFEIYWQDMEICNGCTEITDPDAMEAKIQAARREREKMGKEPHPYPLLLQDALKKGLPVCAGVAIGLDRLCLAIERCRTSRL